jgi:predicted nucleic acid-binding protein
VYLWDANILRHYTEGHPNLALHLKRVKRAEVGLPSVVFAEVLRGRCDYALKARPDQAVQAHALLIDTHRMLARFQIVTFDQQCADALVRLRQQYSSRKRYASTEHTTAWMGINGRSRRRPTINATSRRFWK